MATRRAPRSAPKAAEGETAAPPVASPTIDEVVTQQATDSLVSLMTELGSIDGSRCTVHRAEKNQPLEYVFACAPAEFSLDDLRDKYGGGTFRLFITKPGHTGVWRNLLVHVVRRPGAAPEPVSAANDSLAAVMREGFAQQAQLLQAALARQQEAPPVTMSSVIEKLPALITASAAALQALRPPAPPPAPPSGVGESQVVNLLLKGLELGKELSGGGGGESNMVDILRDLVKSPLLAQAAAATVAHTPQPAARPHMPSITSSAVPATAPPAPAQPVQATGAPPMNMMSLYLGQLAKKAASAGAPGSDQFEDSVALYADLVLDNAPESALQELLKQPDPLAQLASLNPAVMNHREWFQGLIEVVREALTIDDPVPGGIQTGPNGTAHASGLATPEFPGEPTPG